MIAQIRLTTVLFGLMMMAAAARAEEPATALFVVHFETGANWNQELPPAGQDSFAEHSANMSRLRKEGRIVFGARYDALGMIFLKAGNLEQATAFIETDPGVQAGIFKFRIAELRVFYPYEQ